MRLEPLYQKEREQRDREIKEFMQKRFAQKLLSKGMEIEQIAELTELSSEEVRKLIANDQYSNLE